MCMISSTWYDGEQAEKNKVFAVLVETTKSSITIPIDIDWELRRQQNLKWNKIYYETPTCSCVYTRERDRGWIGPTD